MSAPFGSGSATPSGRNAGVDPTAQPPSGPCAPGFPGETPCVLGQVRVDDEVAIDVRAARRQLEGRRHLDDEIRRAEMPAVRELRERGHLRAVAFRHPVLHPVADRRDLRVGQPPLVGELAVAVRRVPGRHVTRLGDFRDRLRVLLHVLVRDQRERRRLPRAMARHAVGVQDGRDALRERQRRRCGPFDSAQAGLVDRA